MGASLPCGTSSLKRTGTPEGGDPVPSEKDPGPETTEDKQKAGRSPNGQPKWTDNEADKLQSAVDSVFGQNGESLLGLEFSFSVADPSLNGCPLIGCSTGFTKLCGYDLDDIVGRNCRFLVDPVPADQIDVKMREHVKQFCEAVQQGKEYRVPTSDYASWMPKDRQGDELFAMQKNARKDGTLFNNMFYMKALDLAPELGKERPYIVALQSELPEGKKDLAKLVLNIAELDKKMIEVKRAFAGCCFMRSSIARQPHEMKASAAYGGYDASKDENNTAPNNLHESFSSAMVSAWDSNRFKEIKVLADATRNRGVVKLMKETKTEKLFAVKRMPNSWVREGHDEFTRKYPTETEMPWQDVGCMKFLDEANFTNVCRLEGVYRDKDHTYVVTSFATEGDLFGSATSEGGAALGPDREVAFAPLVVELLSAMKQLHDMRIVHRDLSLENVLRTKGEDGTLALRVIDFGMASSGRMFSNCLRGKPSYQAPEMHFSEPYDALLSDMFAAGVMVFSLFVKDYPWLSTKPGCCKCFDFVQKNGFRSYCHKRCVRGSKKTIAECLTEPLLQMIEGMVAIDPKQRLTFGESQWKDVGRKSVWDEPWVRGRCKSL